MSKTIARFKSMAIPASFMFLSLLVNAQDADTVNETKKGDDGSVFLVVEESPEFPGGEKRLFRFIKNEVNYPEEARQKGTEGTVVVNFVVDQEGKIEGAKIAKSVSELLDQEALRVVRNMPDWKPGMQKGEKVKVRMNLPIRFTLEDKEDSENDG